MRQRLSLTAAVLGAAMVTPALAVEAFVGRWAASADACVGLGGTAVLVATTTSLVWSGSNCQIGKMYKAGEAVYVLAHCGSSEISVTLAAQGDRMRVTWDRKPLPVMQRCK